MAYASRFDEELLDRLNSHDECVRKVALQSLALEGAKAAAYSSDVGRLLGDEDAEVRRVAASTLAKIGPDCGQVQSLVQALRDKDSGVRVEASRALGVMKGRAGADAAAKLALLAQDPEEEVQAAAVDGLSSLGEAMRLTPFLESCFGAVRRVALVEVARDDVARLTHAPLIADNLAHKEVAVRLAAVQASGELGAACPPDHVAALGKLRTSERQVKVRRATVQALGRIGEAGVEHLLGFLGDADEGIRHFAAQTLSSVGGQRMVDGALGCLSDKNALVRQVALLALGRLNADRAVDFQDSHLVAAGVAAHLHDSDFACRLAAIQALNELAAASQAEALGALCSDPSKGIRLAVVNALAKMDDEGAAQATQFCDDEDEAVRQAAVKVFSPLHSKLPAEVARRYSHTVARKLLDADWRVRFAAVVALGDLRASEYADQVSALSSDDDSQVRRSAVTALEKFGAQAAHVAAFLGDSDPGVCAEAQRAFAALGGGGGGGEDDELSEVD